MNRATADRPAATSARMSRAATAALSGLNALIVVAIGIAIPLAPLTALWAMHFGFAVDWTVFWRAAADIWLLGHGVDLTLTLDRVTASGLDIDGVGSPIPLTIAALGFALLTAVLGVGAGRRMAHSGHVLTGEVAGVGLFGLLALAVTASAAHPAAMPVFWQGVALPTTVFAIGVLIGSFLERERSERLASVSELLDDARPVLSSVLATGVRGGLAAVAFITLVAAIVTAVLLFGAYSEVISLYEALHAGALGGLALTLGQLAFIPNLVIWAASWIVGPGFAVGAGSTVSAVGTNLGPLPAVPMLGAIPTGDSPFGFAWIAVPVIAGFLAGAVFTRRIADEPASVRVGAAAAMGAVGGIVLGMLAWASGGAAGPGRLEVVGPDPWLVGVVAAAEIGVAAVLGAFVAARRG